MDSQTFRVSGQSGALYLWNAGDGPTGAVTGYALESSTTDVAARNEIIATAQQQVLDNGLWIPTIELSQAVGAASTVQDLQFEASARLQFFDTWLSA